LLLALVEDSEENDHCSGDDFPSEPPTDDPNDPDRGVPGRLPEADTDIRERD
jgi:hypothetical protein